MHFLFRRTASTAGKLVFYYRKEVHFAKRYSRVCYVDGAPRLARSGRWMFYLSGTGEKLFHANHGCIDSTHPTRPADDVLDQEWTRGEYSSAEWRTALRTPLDRRLAEIWVVTQRLWRAGLGPRPRGLSFVDRYLRAGVERGPTCGIVIDNANRLPAKTPCADADMIAAGVRPDKIRSAVRQQLRGYVVDLNSVVGVQPIDAEADVQRALEWIEAARAGRAFAHGPSLS